MSKSLYQLVFSLKTLNDFYGHLVAEEIRWKTTLTYYQLPINAHSTYYISIHLKLCLCVPDECKPNGQSLLFCFPLIPEGNISLLSC